MAADCSFFRSSTSFTVCAPFSSADGSTLLVLSLVNVFRGLRAVLLSGWQRIARSSARQQPSQQFARHFAQWMAADCSFFRSPKVFPVCTPFSSVDSSALLVFLHVNVFRGLRAVLLSGWQRIARSSTRQKLSRQFAHRFAQWMAADCSFFRSSTAFPSVCAPFCSVDGSRLLILPLVNVFCGLRVVFLSGWQHIARSFPDQRLSRFACYFAQWMTARCSYFRSSMAFTTVCVPFCSADGSGLLILPLVNSFHHGWRAVLLSGWQWIGYSSTCQRLLPQFARRIAQRMAVDCSFSCLSTAFPTVCATYCSADGSVLLILPLVNGFHHGSYAVLLRGWHWIAHSSARQRLSPQFQRRIAQRMAVDCSFFRSSMAFTTVRALYCSVDGSGLLILPLVNGFHHSS